MKRLKIIRVQEEKVKVHERDNLLRIYNYITPIKYYNRIR